MRKNYLDQLSDKDCFKWGKIPGVHFGSFHKILTLKTHVFLHLLHGVSGGIILCLKNYKRKQTVFYASLRHD